MMLKIMAASPFPVVIEVLARFAQRRSLTPWSLLIGCLGWVAVLPGDMVEGAMPGWRAGRVAVVFPVSRADLDPSGSLLASDAVHFG